MNSMLNDKIADKSSNPKKQNILFFILLLFVAALSIWKAPYGLASNDESFYLTIPNRMLQGDNLLLHEWHLSQFSGVLLLPIMWLYNILGFENGEYMILFFRYAYVLVHILVSIFIYLNIKNKSHAVIIMSTYMLYSPFNIMALSYNSMGIMFLTASLAALYNVDNKRSAVYSGFFFSASVLCNPYLILLYACYFILLCLSKQIKQIKVLNFVDNKVFIKFTIGCIPLAICVISLLLKSSIEDIIKVIPLILSDPEHPSRSILSVLIKYFGAYLTKPFSFFVAFFYLISIIISIIYRKKENLQNYIWLFCSVVIFTQSLFFVLTERSFHINFFQFPIALFGLISFITSNKKDWNAMACFYIPAMAYTFLLHLTSNQMFYTISSASVVASIPSIIFAINKVSDFNNLKLKKLAKASVAALLTAVLIPTLFIRIFMTFRDSNIDLLNIEIQQGHSKGLMTTAENADSYYSVLDDTSIIREQKEGNILYFMLETGLYLTDNKSMASYSAWTSIVPWDGIIPKYPNCNRLNEYYNIVPEKKPDYVYIHTKDYSIVEYIMNELSLKGDLYEGEQGYSIIVK